MEKKRSSINWLKKQYYQSEGKLTKYDFEQAKAMHKEEVRVAYMDGAFEKIRHLDGKEFIMPTDYYNETFEGENE